LIKEVALHNLKVKCQDRINTKYVKQTIGFLLAREKSLCQLILRVSCSPLVQGITGKKLICPEKKNGWPLIALA
jgi:hypothetical protein